MASHKDDPWFVGPESKEHGALIKRGKVSYTPVPIFDAALQEAETLAVKNSAKNVQVGKELRTVNEVVPQFNVAEEVARVREESQKMVEKARGDAERVLGEAQNKAKKLIEQSKLYCETAYANAEREGFANGQREGRNAGFEEAKGLILSARQTFEQIISESDRLAKAAEHSLAKLAIKIAERVIASEVSINPNVILNMVKANLERVKEREQVILRVHPEDLEMVTAKKEMFSQFVPGVRSLEIVSDGRVERGGCMIETNLGIVDARVSTQLEAIQLAFEKAENEEKEVTPDAGVAGDD